MSRDSPQTASTTSNPPPDTPQPEIEWREELITDDQYRLTITVQLDQADEVVVETVGGGTITTLTTNGEHIVAGSETNHGPLTLGTSVNAILPDTPVDRMIGTYSVGSQIQPTIPLHLNGLTGGTHPPQDVQGAHSRTYTQTVGNQTTRLSLTVPKALYQYYQRRMRVGDYGAYVSDTNDDEYITRLAEQFKTFRDRNNLSDREMIDHVTGFVQQLQYTRDEPATGYNEYPKFPTETLVDQGGDCEDTCILLSSILERTASGPTGV
ncbi:hypothetical protein [Natrinema pellirubrum]|uniref:hypothetical protein n=1 Tax=Natrinema pellirubrum TaxID=69525 RepID=UPI00126851FD|nr:hypothetical protein [Natrinema pellirubrum]